MGLLVDGKWQDTWYDTDASGGRFKREESGFRNWVTADGSAGPTGISGFQAEPDRYHLYVSLACPWAHRTTIFRKLKGLDDMISLSVVHPFMGDYGWTFKDGAGVIADPINHADYAYEIYTAAKADYTGRVTVPILWDKKTNTIVSNESSEIIRMFNSAFDEVGALPVDFLHKDKWDEIDEINALVYSAVNNGVYKSGFATTQDAYEEAVGELFAALDVLESRLAGSRYLVGDSITEADWRLFTTLVRFDAVYFGHFKCNLRRIVDYPNLWGYLKELYQVPGIAQTVNMDHIKSHYYTSHANINPTGIVPVGPKLDFEAPHNRGK
ncbi:MULTISPECIES: glutathione S-transferase family protein [unclassified Psychrobacter]|uniref:glutathione S-transferase family protein n=1 Tax=unclassified Psychrobacter TaxID=196806 RepID=UPI003FD57E56